MKRSSKIIVPGYEGLLSRIFVDYRNEIYDWGNSTFLERDLTRIRPWVKLAGIVALVAGSYGIIEMNRKEEPPMAQVPTGIEETIKYHK